MKSVETWKLSTALYFGHSHNLKLTLAACNDVLVRHAAAKLTNHSIAEPDGSAEVVSTLLLASRLMGFQEEADPLHTERPTWIKKRLPA